MRASARTILTAALLAVLWLAVPGPESAAHQLRAAITTVLFNPRTGNIEVMHRFYSHDAEHALALITGETADLLDDAGDRMDFARYVHQRFELDGMGAPLAPLNLVGAEAEGDFLWVYQRTPLVPQLTGLEVRFDALRDVWRDQVNTLNVERDGQVHTLIFAGDARQQSVTF